MAVSQKQMSKKLTKSKARNSSLRALEFWWRRENRIAKAISLFQLLYRDLHLLISVTIITFHHLAKFYFFPLAL